MDRSLFFSFIAASQMARLIIVMMLCTSEVSVDGFPVLLMASSSTTCVSNRQPSRCQLSMFHDDESSPMLEVFLKNTRFPSRWPTPRLGELKTTRILPELRLSLSLLFSVPVVLASAGCVEPAEAVVPVATEQQGISAVTQSSLGTSVRSTVVQSAKMLDAIDLRWERFSDSLRDKKQCDPRTNRRLFDNGIRGDGTPRGNPVLGALCAPVELKPVDETLMETVLEGALADAAYETLGIIDNNNNIENRASLQQLVDKTRVRVEPAFTRAVDAKTKFTEATNGSPSAAALSSSTTSGDSITSTRTSVVVDEARKRQKYNLEVYTRVRAYGEAIASPPATSNAAVPGSTAEAAPLHTTKPLSRAALVRQSGKTLDRLWGRNLLDRLAGPATAEYKFQSPFPKPDADIPLPYEEGKLTNALGAIEVALQKLQDGGLIGHWEISIPEDDYGEVVTIAIDDDVCLGAQILAREERSVLVGSPVVAMVRSALEDRAKIPYAALDVFFIDPTTTKNELYNPTQLLVSVRNLGEEQEY